MHFPISSSILETLAQTGKSGFLHEVCGVVLLSLNFQVLLIL